MLFEVDASVEGYDIRHTYVVVADDESSARHKAEKKFRGWLMSKVITVYSREAQIVR